MNCNRLSLKLIVAVLVVIFVLNHSIDWLIDPLIAWLLDWLIGWKFRIQKNAGGLLERFVDGTFGRTWLGSFHHVQSKTHGVAVFDYFQIRSFVMIL